MNRSLSSRDGPTAKTDLLTASHVFRSLWTELDCRADRIALRDEKFFSW